MPRSIGVIFLMLVAAAVAVVARLYLGGDAVAWPETTEILGLRGSRAAAGVIVGAALGASGVMLQALFRNPVASPDLLGQSSGAGLAVILAVYAGHAAGVPTPPYAVAPASLFGAVGAIVLVYLLAQRRGRVDPVTLVLTGVMVSVLCGAATTLVQHLMPPDPARTALRWLFGGLSEETTWRGLSLAGLIVAAGVAAGSWLGPAMDAGTLTEDEARSVGVRVGVLRTTLFVVSGVLAATAVVLAGPIGFVGLVAPHVVRSLAGPRHRLLVIGASLAGGAMVVGADALVAAARTAAPGVGRLPIGVVTALLGAPIFVWMLRSRAGALPGA